VPFWQNKAKSAPMGGSAFWQNKAK